MTKCELIEFLMPFVDEIEIVIKGRNSNRGYGPIDLDDLGYAVKDGVGIVVIEVND